MSLGKFKSYSLRRRVSISDLRNASEIDAATRGLSEILMAKGVSPNLVPGAVKSALDAAANFTIEHDRSDVRRETHISATHDRDALICLLDQLNAAISKLPASTKGKINSALASVYKDYFDTETFGELIDQLIMTLSESKPAKLALDARKLIEVENPEQSPRCFRYWENLPAMERLALEARIRRDLTVAPLRLLRDICDWLDESGLERKRGAGRSVLRHYIQEVDRIWLDLGLLGRRNYDHEDGHIISDFQQFCSCALRGAGHLAPISIRQLDHLSAKRRKST